ncbi:MAG: type II toxin-antitoxin system Phd/YefM family antitoxin [Rubrobacteraceae bacterium]
MRRVDLSRDLKPLSEFRANAAAVVRQVRDTKRPVVLTQRGKGAVVLLDVGEYEALVERVELLEDVRAAERQVEAGEGIAREEAEARALARPPE